jgi:RHS repeat-associated protein
VGANPFGETVEDTVILQSVNPLIQADNRTQPLRWKGMWRFDLGGGVELYDARARMWSPELGTFLSVDEFAFHDARSTLWGWPGQNSIKWRDPSGRIGMGDSASSDRAIGSSQNWGDSSFQSGLNNSAVFDAYVLSHFTPLGYLLDAGLFVGSDKDLPLLGLMGLPPGAASPAEAAAARAAAAASREGMITAESGEGAGSCVAAQRASGGVPRHGPVDRVYHVAETTPEGLVNDPTLRGNIQAYGGHVGDIPAGQTQFTPEEWESLVQRLPRNPGEPGMPGSGPEW